MKLQSLILKSILIAGALAAALSINAQNNPVANQEAVAVSGNARFTVLTPEMIRVEYSDSGRFEDRATFAVVNRELPVPPFQKDEDEEFLYITTDKLALKYRKGTNPLTSPASDTNLTITLADGTAQWFPGKVDSLNLKGTCRTLDGSNGDNKRAELENGLVSRSGWAVIDDSPAALRPDGSRSLALVPDAETRFDWWADRPDSTALDLYFMGYGKDYRKALADFTAIAGKIPLPPAYVFGYWYSKYASYCADDYRNIMDELESNNIPCDVMILDMDWHWNGDMHDSAGRGGWTGWSWNTNLIPDPEGLLSDIHDRKFRIALNLHPADGVARTESPGYFDSINAALDGKYTTGDTIPWILDNTDFAREFFRTVIRDHESEGVDFWWLDWQQHLTSRYNPGLGETFWCNHVFFNDMKENRPDRRPVIFHRWGGLGSHRYQIGFSGDAFISFPTLAFQPYFTATASNVGYGYWGHDLGGHMITGEIDANDPELVLRWLQFGVFTPIFRTHATKDSRIERQIWKFPNFQAMNNAVRLRYALFPYIYTMAREAYDTGVAICRPLYYHYPESEEAYTFENEYMFGSDILVAPITQAATDGISTMQIWFPEGNWWSANTNELIQGPCIKTMDFTLDQYPYFFRQGAVVPLNPPTVENVTEHPDHLILHIVAGASGSGSLYEDSGDNADYDTTYAHTNYTYTHTPEESYITIGPRIIHGADTIEGLPAARTYTIRILNADAPADTSTPAARTYDPATRTLTITTPALSTADPHTLPIP